MPMTHCIGCEKAGGLRPCVCNLKVTQVIPYGRMGAYGLEKSKVTWKLDRVQQFVDDMKKRFEDMKQQDEIKVIEDKATGKKYKVIPSMFDIIKREEGDLVLRPLKEKPMPEIEIGDYVIAYEDIKDPAAVYVTELNDRTVYGVEGEPLPRRFISTIYRNGSKRWSKGDE